jgi:hypothetical protein
MTMVRLQGWNPGLNKIQLNHVLREESGAGLADAKALVDRLLEGHEVRVVVADRDAADRLIRRAKEVGVTHAETVDTTRP